MHAYAEFPADVHEFITPVQEINTAKPPNFPLFLIALHPIPQIH